VIVGIDPGSRDVGGHIKNGAMINPVSDDGQAYDSLAPLYKADKNVAFDVDEQNPLIVMADSSLISSISVDVDTAVRPQLNVAAVLTVLAVIPPANAFRPPYSGSDKSIRAVKDDIDWSKLSNLPKPEGALSYDDLVTCVQMNKGPWLDHWGNWQVRYIHPAQNMPDYGRNMAHLTGEAALALNLDYTAEEKEPILINYLQIGIDLYGIIEAGDIQNWINNGGHMVGRKLPILFAGTVLQNSDIIEMFQKTGDYLYVSVDVNGYPNPTGPSNPPTDYIYFQDDDQTCYITQFDYDLTNNLIPGTPWNPSTPADQFPYRLTDIGMPEWGLRHVNLPEKNTRNIGADYRSLNAVTYLATALAVHKMGMKEEWKS